MEIIFMAGNYIFFIVLFFKYVFLWLWCFVNRLWAFNQQSEDILVGAQFPSHTQQHKSVFL